MTETFVSFATAGGGSCSQAIGAVASQEDFGDLADRVRFGNLDADVREAGDVAAVEADEMGMFLVIVYSFGSG